MADFLIQAFSLIESINVALYVPLYIIASLLIIPGMAMAFLSGFLFGPVKGFLVLYSASIMSSMIAFYIGRGLHHFKFSSYFHGLTRKYSKTLGHGSGFNFWALIYASPFTPFRSLNYILGASHIKSSVFFKVLVIGFIPHMLPYALLGALASNTEQILAGELGFDSSWMWYSSWIALTVLAILPLFLPAIYRKFTK